MPIYQIRELTLKQLDVAVAICEGFSFHIENQMPYLSKKNWATLGTWMYQPTSDGNNLVTLMQKYKVEVSYHNDTDTPFWSASVQEANHTQYGQNAFLTVAICQAIVLFVTGSTTIELPEGI